MSDRPTVCSEAGETGQWHDRVTGYCDNARDDRAINSVACLLCGYRKHLWPHTGKYA